MTFAKFKKQVYKWLKLESYINQSVNSANLKMCGYFKLMSLTFLWKHS